MKQHNLKNILFFRAPHEHRFKLLSLWAFQIGTGQEEEDRTQFCSEWLFRLSGTVEKFKLLGQCRHGNGRMQKWVCNIRGRSISSPGRDHRRTRLGGREKSYRALPGLLPAFGIQSSALLPKSAELRELLKKKRKFLPLLRRTDRQPRMHPTCHFKSLSTHFTLHLQVPRAQFGVMFP